MFWLTVPLIPVHGHLSLSCSDHGEGEHHGDKGRKYKSCSSHGRRGQDSIYTKNTLLVTYFFLLGDSAKDLGFNIRVCEGISYLGHGIDLFHWMKPSRPTPLNKHYGPHRTCPLSWLHLMGLPVPGQIETERNHFLVSLLTSGVKNQYFKKYVFKMDTFSICFWC